MRVAEKLDWKGLKYSVRRKGTFLSMFHDFWQRTAVLRHPNLGHLFYWYKLRTDKTSVVPC
jgi:hypothetical protein